MKNVIKLLLSLSCLISFSCAIGPSKKTNVLFLGDKNTENKSYSSIKSDLSKMTSEFYFQIPGNYVVTAYPYTGALIEAEEREKGKKNMESAPEIEKSITDQKKLFVSNKSCFMVTINSASEMGIESAQFKNIILKIEQPSQNFSKLDVLNRSSVESVPTSVNKPALMWENSSIVCSSNKIDFSKQFSLHVIPQIVGLKALTLIWEPEVNTP